LVALVGFKFVCGNLIWGFANTKALGYVANVQVLYVEDVFPVVAVAGVGA